jgi:hypothetical protein
VGPVPEAAGHVHLDMVLVVLPPKPAVRHFLSSEDTENHHKIITVQILQKVEEQKFHK